METTFVSFPAVCLTRNPEAILRPVPEWGRCLVYTPDDPELFELNATAWLALELCNGRPFGEVEDEFADVVADKMPAEDARRDFRSTVERLKALGVVIETGLSS